MRPSFVGSVSVRKSGWPGQARCAPDFTVRAGFVVRISFRSSKPGRDGEQEVRTTCGRGRALALSPLLNCDFHHRQARGRALMSRALGDFKAQCISNAAQPRYSAGSGVVVFGARALRAGIRTSNHSINSRAMRISPAAPLFRAREAHASKPADRHAKSFGLCARPFPRREPDLDPGALAVPVFLQHHVDSLDDQAVHALALGEGDLT
jgi:hypothetical protein